MKATTWRGVAVAMESALATAVTITAITKASPGVVSYTGTDPVNGDYVLLEVTGMEQLNNVVSRVAGVDGTGNTFQLEGIDTTLFDTFTAGTARVITFGTSISTMIDMKPSGGDPKYVDNTTLSQLIDTNQPDGYNAAKYDFDNILKASDAGLLAMRAAMAAEASKCFKVRWRDGTIAVFPGYPACSMMAGGSDKVTTPASISLLSLPTYYAS